MEYLACFSTLLCKVLDVLLILTQYVLLLKLKGGEVRRRIGKSNRPRETHPARGPGWSLWMCQAFITSRWIHFPFPSSQARRKPSISREVGWGQRSFLFAWESSVVKEITGIFKPRVALSVRSMSCVPNTWNSLDFPVPPRLTYSYRWMFICNWNVPPKK